MPVLPDFRISFKRQLILALAVFSTLVSLIWSLVMFAGVQQTEDHLLNRQLELEFIRLQDKLPTEMESADYLRRWLVVYSDVLPTGMSVVLSEDVPDTYLPFIEDNEATESEDENLHFYRGFVGGYSFTLIMVEEHLSEVGSFEPYLLAILFAITLFILFISMMLAIWLGKKLAAPLEELTHALIQDPPPESLPAVNRQDEIGTLARTFSRLINRLSQFLQREKQFTRHASHEMRTPVTLIANSLSVLKLANIDEQKRQRNIVRIENALTDITQLIDTFLMLGREDNPQRKDEWLDLGSMLEEWLVAHGDMHQHVEVAEIARPKVFADRKLVNILIGNLLSNSVKYSAESIHLVLSHNELRISNDLGQQSEQTKGFGFGQEIISRICDLFDWQYETQRLEGAYQAIIRFPQS